MATMQRRAIHTKTGADGVRALVVPVVIQGARDPATMKRGVREIYFSKWSGR
ncbi:hypothetical protein ACOJBO_08140 [Rhizobium beringeri]